MSSRLQRAAHRTVGPILERLVASATDRRGRLPTPDDEPRVFAPGPNPYRILMMGGGVVRGNGVTSHDLGLGGNLARRLSTLTGRGTEVDIQWRPMMSPATAIALLDEFDLTEFDAVLVILGSREAVSLLPLGDWRKQVTEVIEAVRRNASDSLPVFFVGIPQMPDFLSMPAPIRASIVRHTGQLNDETEQLSLTSNRVGYLPISVAHGSLQHYGDAKTYGRWAGQLAPAIAWALEQRPTDGQRQPDVDENARREALHRFRRVIDAHDKRFDRIADSARDLLGASASSIAFLDDEDPIVKSMRGGPLGELLRNQSFVVATIQSPTALVVAGDELVERFGEHPWVRGPEHVRFYAGYPIATPDGYRVGALAVVAPEPRPFTAEDEAVLRELAGKVQTLLWEGARA